MPTKGQGKCEVVSGEHPNPLQRVCTRPAVLRYPAMGGGWMHLCAEHGAQHARIVDRFGERWDGQRWAKPHAD